MHVRRLTGALFASLVCVLLVVGVLIQPARGESQPMQPTLVIGMSGMSTSDIDFQSGAIANNLANAGFANALIRSTSVYTCRNEGWMSLVASGDIIDQAGRSSVSSLPDKCPSFSVTPLDSSSPSVTGAGAAHVNDFPTMIATVNWPDSKPFGADTLAIGDGAAIALADSSGQVAQWMPFSPATIGEALVAAPGDVVVDIGAVRGAPTETASRSAQKAEINDNLAAVLEAQASSGVERRVVIASLGTSWNYGELQFFATTGFASSAAFESAGVISSTYTRAPGFITRDDIHTVLAGTGDGLSLAPYSSTNDAVAFLTMQENHATYARMATPSWYRTFNLLALGGIVGAVALFLVRPAVAGPWAAPKRLWAILTHINRLAFAFVPAALILNLIPWWRLSLNGAAVSLVPITLTALLAAALTLVASRVRYPMALLGLIALVVLGGDVILGSVHQRNGFMGSLMLTSRRFYGISNRTYLILIVAGLLTVLPAVSKAQEARSQLGTANPVAVRTGKRAGIIVALVGGAVLLVDALPAWGADFGGPPGIIAGFGLAAVLAAGIRPRWWHVLVWIVTSVACMGLVGLLDARSGSSSHIGSFWSTIGSPESFEMIRGKIRDVIRSFVGRTDVIILLVGVIVVALLAMIALRKLDQRSKLHVNEIRALITAPDFRIVALGILTGILIAVPINDSGALMLKEGFYIAVPALIALLCERHVRSQVSAQHAPVRPEE